MYSTFCAILQVPDIRETSMFLQYIFHGANIIVNDLNEDSCEVFLAAGEGRSPTTIRFASTLSKDAFPASGYQGPEIRLCLHVEDLKPIDDALKTLSVPYFVFDHLSIRFSL